MWSIATRKNRKGYPEAELLSVYREYGVIRKSDRNDNHNVESEDLSSYKLVKKGDLVLNKMKTWQGSLGVSPYDGIVSPAYFVCELNSSVYGSFIHYLLRSEPYIAMYGAASKGIRVGQWDLPYEEFRDLPVILPPFQLQIELAKYLDEKISIIDALVAKFASQLSEARELFQVLLEGHTSDVLNVEDPAIKIRRVAKLDTIVELSTEFDSDVTFLGLEDVQPGTLANFSRIRPLSEVKTGYSRFISGDILLPKVSPSFGQGRAVIAPHSVSKVGFASTEIYSLRANNAIDNQYLCACLRARNFLNYGESNYQGVAGVKRVDKESILNWKIRWPEPKKRTEIVSSVNEAQENLQEIELKTNEIIQRLFQLKSSLIVEATTGRRLIND